jgi:hypothetical protein
MNNRFRLYRIRRCLGNMLEWQQIDLLAPMYPAVQELRTVHPVYSALGYWIKSTHTPSMADRRMNEEIDFKKPR